MTPHIQQVAQAVRQALEQRGIASLDSLTHKQQERVADKMGVRVTELHDALKPLPAPRGYVIASQVDRTLADPADPTPAAGSKVGWRPETEIDSVAEMLGDLRNTVWAQIVVIEARLGLRPKGTRSDRYWRVRDRLEEIRQQEIKKPTDDRVYDLVNSKRRQLRDAERRYAERQAESAEALRSLGRQSAAVRAAAVLGAPR